MAVNEWRHVRVELQGPRLRIFVDNAGQPQIDFTDEQPLGPGSIGLRTFNASMSVRNLKVTADNKSKLVDFRPATIEPPRTESATSASAQQRALASLCLLILNVNEFVYID